MAFRGPDNFDSHASRDVCRRGDQDFVQKCDIGAIEQHECPCERGLGSVLFSRLGLPRPCLDRAGRFDGAPLGTRHASVRIELSWWNKDSPVVADGALDAFVLQPGQEAAEGGADRAAVGIRKFERCGERAVFGNRCWRSLGGHRSVLANRAKSTRATHRFRQWFTRELVRVLRLSESPV